MTATTAAAAAAIATIYYHYITADMFVVPITDCATSVAINAVGVASFSTTVNVVIVIVRSCVAAVPSVNLFLLLTVMLVVIVIHFIFFL